MTRVKAINSDVFVAEDRVVTVSRGGFEEFQRRAAESERHRARLCAHKDNANRINEMFIALTSDAYIRPHRHLNKSESFHVIEGTATVIFFDENGKIEEVIHIGDYQSGKPFFYRNEDERFHAQIVTSPRLVFHEITNGPFDPAETEWAPWSPDESDPELVKDYLNGLKAKLGLPV